MGKTILAIGFILLMVCTVGANQTLTPVDIGTPNTTGQSLGSDPYLYPGFWVGQTDQAETGGSCGACHAVVQFDISGVNPSLCQAYLKGIQVEGLDVSEVDPGDGYFTVQVYSLADLYEDGVVTSGDFGQNAGPPLATLNITPGSVGTVFNNIDVSDAVRHDLSGSGQTHYAGFILISSDMHNESVEFNENIAHTGNHSL